MQLRERLELRRLADEIYGARANEMVHLQLLADRHGVDRVLDWLKAGVPRPMAGRPHLARFEFLEELLRARISPPMYRSALGI